MSSEILHALCALVGKGLLGVYHGRIQVQTLFSAHGEGLLEDLRRNFILC